MNDVDLRWKDIAGYGVALMSLAVPLTVATQQGLLEQLDANRVNESRTFVLPASCIVTAHAEIDAPRSAGNMECDR